MCHLPPSRVWLPTPSRLVQSQTTRALPASLPHPVKSVSTAQLTSSLVRTFPRGGCYAASAHPSHPAPLPAGCRFSGGPYRWTGLSRLHAITAHVIFHLKRSPLAVFQSALIAVMRFPGTLWNPTDSLGSSTRTPHNPFIPIAQVAACDDGKESA